MPQAGINPQQLHPMMKLQQKVRSLVDSKVIKPTDNLWKISLLYGDEWPYWKKELLDFGFSTQDPVCELLSVEQWDDD
jgi:Domain of unknown function (DUF4327)